MVVVDVEDGDFLVALVEEGLGGDGGVVQVAVTTHQLASGMVTWRPAQGEGAVSPFGDLGLGTQCHLRGAVSGLPGAGGNWCAAVEAVIAKLAVQIIRDDLTQGACRPGEGQQVTVAVLRLPARPGTLEEVQISGAVNTLNRRQAEILRRTYFTELAMLDARQDMVGALRFLETGHQLAVDQLAAAVVQVMVVAVKGEHVTRLQACCCACIVRLHARMENAGNGQKGIEMAKFGGRRALMAPRKL